MIRYINAAKGQTASEVTGHCGSGFWKVPKRWQRVVTLLLPRVGKDNFVADVSDQKERAGRFKNLTSRPKG